MEEREGEGEGEGGGVTGWAGIGRNGGDRVRSGGEGVIHLFFLLHLQKKVEYRYFPFSFV